MDAGTVAVEGGVGGRRPCLDVGVDRGVDHTVAG